MRAVPAFGKLRTFPRPAQGSRGPRAENRFALFLVPLNSAAGPRAENRFALFLVPLKVEL
ncbi:hypothetical protein LCM4579_02190 [Ensifer sp. LCM 4579]|nr:hypothetical protein LCM4579_02190 [Ensifer sp. LCM 4579]